MTGLAIPTLETERLRLRGPEERDIPAWEGFYRSERSAYVGGPLARNLVWRSLASYLGHWAMRGYGYFAVEDRESGTLYGNVGPWFPMGWPEPEIGWTLLGAAEGRGIAHEAALAARAWAYESLRWSTAISLIAPGNTRSARLAERLGARHESDFEHDEYGPMLVYRHPSAAELAA